MRKLAVASLCVSLLGFAVADSSGLPRKASAHKASAPACQGKARRMRPAHVSFSFSCEGDVSAFDIQANRALHSVDDPSYVFGCERRTSRSSYCEDIHSGAEEGGSGV